MQEAAVQAVSLRQSKASPPRGSLHHRAKRIGLMLALVALAGCCSRDLRAQQELTLQAALQSALQQSPALQSKQAAERSAEWRIQQARAGRLPSINYSEEIGRAHV